jgi:hypothetical protein
VYSSKTGSLWAFTDYWPYVDYEVNPHWLTGWWSLGKYSHEQYERYLLKCRRSYRTLHQNFEAVVAAERAEAMEEYKSAVLERLASTRLPFRQANDALFPKLRSFLDQFQWASERYLMYALRAPSQAAKTSFIKSLFKTPFVVTIQGQDSLNLQGFKFGVHDALVLDNLVDWELILKYRAMLQANVDVHKLGETTTSIFAYPVFLWATPVLITLDEDVDCAPYFASKWLCANVLLDTLASGDKCYLPGVRAPIPMADMPKLRL